MQVIAASGDVPIGLNSTLEACMKQRFTNQELFTLRNKIPIEWLILNELKLRSEDSNGTCRFECPWCRKFQTATNRATNLARCFSCQRNFNVIDLVMATKHTGFVESVEFLCQCSSNKQFSKSPVLRSEPCPTPLAVSEILRRLIFGGAQ